MKQETALAIQEMVAVIARAIMVLGTRDILHKEINASIEKAQQELTNALASETLEDTGNKLATPGDRQDGLSYAPDGTGRVD